MVGVMMESLERREFLSVAGGAGMTEGLSTFAAALYATPQNSAVRIVGDYVGSGTVAGQAGRVVLRVTSQVGEKVKARLYSSDWGVFDVSLSGTLRAGRLSLAGSSATCVVKRITGTVSSSAGIRVSVSVEQMGLPVNLTMQLTRTRTAPPLVTPRVARLAGRLTGTAMNGEDRTPFTMWVTRQEGGHVWVTVKDNEGVKYLKGVVLKNGSFRMMSRTGGGTLDITGKVLADRSLQGEYAWQGPGERDSGRIIARAG